MISQWRRIKFSKGLHIQLLLLTVVPTAIVLLGITWRGALFHEEAMRELVGRRDARSTEVAANNLAERLHEREIILAIIAKHLGSTDQELQNMNTNELTTLFDYGLIITEETGDVLNAWLPQGGWEWREAEGKNRTLVGHSDSEVLVVFSTQLERNRYLYGATSLVQLGIPGIIQDLVSNEHTHAYLIDEDGHILYASYAEQVDQPLPNSQAVSAVLTGESGFLRKSEQDEIIGYSPITRLGWGLVVEEPWESVTSPQFRVTHSLTIIIIAILLLGLVVVSFSTLWVIRPLQRLENRASLLVQGNFSAIVQPVGGIQEIGDLQQSLIQMAKAVQQAQTRLHNYIGAITTAQEDERTRLARELHDDTVQTLIALNHQTQMAQRTLERDPTSAYQRLSEVRLTVEQAIQDIRNMIHGLRPSYLSELGLVPALEALAEQENSPLKVQLEVSGEVQRLPDAVEMALYRITHEALNNIHKHSGADHASIILSFAPESTTLTITDNGRGFNVPEFQQLTTSGHYGLIGMQERAQLIGATLKIESSLYQGTTLSLHIERAKLSLEETASNSNS